MVQLAPPADAQEIDELTRYRPHAGDQVYTLDGKWIGAVIDAVNSHFRVAMSGDVGIISVESVYSRDDGAVVLICDGFGLHRHLLG